MGSIPCMDTEGLKAYCILQGAPNLTCAGLDGYFLDEGIVGGRHPAPPQVPSTTERTEIVHNTGLAIHIWGFRKKLEIRGGVLLLKPSKGL